MGRAGLVLLLLLLGAGCSEEPPPPAATKTQEQAGAKPSGEQAAPALSGTAAPSVAILPLFPKTGNDLQAVVRGARGVCCFAWERNGELIQGEESDRLDHRHFGKGDEIRVRLTVGDQLAMATTTIGNTPPEVVSVDFRDPEVHRGVDIVALPEGADVDGDPVQFRYRWWVNGDELTWIDGNILPGDRFAKGDTVRLEVVPFDGIDEGPPFGGQDFVIPNAPPYFESTPPLTFEARTYRYQVRAEDPDEDPLTFLLEQGPAGMTIDAGSGLLTWDLTQAAPGDHRVRIAAVDPEGARAFQEYIIQLSPSGGGGS